MTRTAPFAWFEIGCDAWMLGVESAAVIAMRSMMLAAGGAAAQREAHRMVAEKAAAGLSLGSALAAGRFGFAAEAVAEGTIAHYRRRVRINRRRLGRTFD